MKQVTIEILETTSEMIKVKMPFTTLPIEMTYDFFRKRAQQGYFLLKDGQNSILNISASEGSVIPD